MSAARKIYRIERFQAPAADPEPPVAGGHEEILREIRELKECLQPAQEITESVLQSYQSEFAEVQKLKGEIDQMYAAINETKKEIATLHTSGFQGEEMGRVTSELDAIINGTEKATETILSSAEVIDERANDLSARLRSDQNIGMANDISDNVINIFEACNFQDLTGQRITKIVRTLQFVEDRIIKMMDIWGGIDSFKEIEADPLVQKRGDAALLNGPSLEGDENVASQDDIDALFP